jgi:glycosyltransferase involved in cell wall biosynthesis
VPEISFSSVVVPAYNEEKLISGTLACVAQSLRDAGLGEQQFELIVTDNDSTDATPRLAAEAGARVVFEPERHIARARNAGAAVARGQWLLFVDADSWPDRHLMTDLLACLRDGRAHAGGCTVRMQDVPVGIRMGVAGWNAFSRMTRWAAGAFLFCRADAFRDVGGFALEFFVAEEIDLSRRLKRWGRERGCEFRILSRHPLLTSGRKVHLYGPLELGGLFLRMLCHPRRFFRDRGFCYPWYDGRR